MTANTKVTAFFETYTLRTAKKGEILIHAGEEPTGIFYLTSGRVREYDISDQGRELVVNLFTPGAFFPMSWAINRTPNSYFFEAVTPVTYRCAPAADTVAFLKDNPDVLYDLLARVYRGTDGMLRRTAYIMGGGARKRVLFELYIYCLRLGKAYKGGCMLDVRESELARSAGLSRETVSRELQKLKDNGELHVESKKLVVRDMASLEQALGFDSAA